MNSANRTVLLAAANKQFEQTCERLAALGKWKYQPNTLKGAIAHLRAAEAAHVRIGHEVITAAPGRSLPVDLAIPGLIQRSLMLIRGFTQMVEQANFACALPLLRLQIDNSMRLYAFMVAKEPNDVLKALLDETPLTRLRSRDGKPLTDRYLHTQLSKSFPWMSGVYEKTSGSIHFSTPGFHNALVRSDDESRTVYFSVGSEAGRQWEEQERKEAVDGFIEATEAFLAVLKSIRNAKKEEAASHIRS